MKREIFTKDWLELHPYKTADAVDQYYVSLANAIYFQLKELGFAELFDKKQDAKHLALCLAAYFEDVITGLGIWRAFTTECQKRYGVYVPFYIKLFKEEEYYLYEINIQDVLFIMWHHFQQSVYDKEALPPIFDSIGTAALGVFTILDNEYENAPSNERLLYILCDIDIDEEHFYDYRKILEWFHYDCYFNVGNKKRLLEATKKDKEKSEEYNDVMRYSTKMEQMMGSRHNLLALSSAEWLAKISEQHPSHKLWTDVDFRPIRFFSIDKEDKDFVYAKDLYLGDTLKVTKASLKLDNFDDYIKGKTVCATTMFKFGSAWWQNGALIGYPFDKVMKDDIKRNKDKYLHKKEIDNYQLLKKSGNAHKILILKDQDELIKLYESAGYKMAKGLKLPEPNAKGIIVSGSPYTGLMLTFHMAHCISSKDYPFYDPIKAEEDAIDIITGACDAFSYEAVCQLIDQHLLADANIFSHKYDTKEGIRITQENLQFLADYHLRKRRDKDLSPEELW